MFTSQLKLQGRRLTNRLIHQYPKIQSIQSRNFFQQFNSLNALKDKVDKDKSERKVAKDETEFERALREAKEDSLVPQIAMEAEKKSLWERVKHEADHYWSGSKLLAAETSISSRLLLKTLKGKELSRREYRQVSRNG
jgi:LETM1 and EF-hand domain-containing protein 1